MPIREFCCNTCGKVFEELIRSEQEEQSLCCPVCGGKSVSRLFSVFGVAGTEKKVQVSSKSCGQCSSHSCGSCS